MAIGNEAAYEFFMERVPDGLHRRQLLAFEADARGQPAAERIAEWTALLEDATDNAMAARTIAALVKLGAWSARADDLPARARTRGHLADAEGNPPCSDRGYRHEYRPAAGAGGQFLLTLR